MRILQLLCLTEMVVGYTVSPSNCQGCKKLLNARYNNHSRRYNKLIRGCKSIEGTCHQLYECSVYNRCGVYRATVDLPDDTNLAGNINVVQDTTALVSTDFSHLLESFIKQAESLADNTDEIIRGTRDQENNMKYRLPTYTSLANGAVYSWGKSVGNSEGTVDWSLCPTLQKPDGVSSIICDQATCMGICKPGYRPPGRGKRVTCHKNDSRPAKWHGNLGKLSPCQTCPSLPNALCSVNKKNRFVCNIACDNNPTKFHKFAKCLCHKKSKSCSWNFTNVEKCETTVL